MTSMFRNPTIASCLGVLLLGCDAAGDEPSGELVIHRADASGLSGEYRADGAAIYFESHRTSADAPITARFFDDNGTVVAGRHPGESAPADWHHNTAPSDQVLALMPAAIDALAAADLALDSERDALVELAGETVALEADATPPGQAFANWVYFPLYCGLATEGGYIGGQNWEYVSRYATVTFYFSGGGSVRYSGWVQARSVRFYMAGGRYLSSGYGSGTGSMSFYQAGNWCN